MTHQQVVEAAVQAAARHGVEATVIVLGSRNGGSNSQAASVVPVGEDGYAVVEHEHYHHSVTDSEVAEKLGTAEKRIEELTVQLSHRDRTISDLSAATEVAMNAAKNVVMQTTQVAQPTELVSIDAYSIDVLGLSEEVSKKLKKVYANIGDLRAAAATSGRLAALKLKGGNNTIIDICERLIGKVPPERIPSSAPATTKSGSLVSDAPAGHSDRPWLDRLGAVKAKERDMREWANKMQTIKAANPVEGEMPDDEYDKLLDARHEHDIAKSQVIALVWGLGLDKEHLREGGSVDACLIAAGLTHLTDNPGPAVVSGATPEADDSEDTE